MLGGDLGGVVYFGVIEFVEYDVQVVYQWQYEGVLQIEVIGQYVLQLWDQCVIDDCYDQQVGCFVGYWFELFDVQCEDGWEYD